LPKTYAFNNIIICAYKANTLKIYKSSIEFHLGKPTYLFKADYLMPKIKTLYKFGSTLKRGRTFTRNYAQFGVVLFA